MTLTPHAGRDLRLDFFRGLSLWFIFLNHIPSSTVGWLTNRNYGFSDAAEIFVFLSGYTAAFVYGRIMLERGFVVASARILKRVWQLYVAFVFLSVIYIAQTAYVAHRLTIRSTRTRWWSCISCNGPRSFSPKCCDCVFCLRTSTSCRCTFC